MRLLFLVYFMVAAMAFGAENFYYDGEKKVLLKQVQTQLRSNVGVQFYELESGVRVGVSDGILVWFESDENLEDYLKEFDAVAEKRIDANLYLLRVRDKSQTIESANLLHQKEDVRFAHPDFLRSRELR